MEGTEILDADGWEAAELEAQLRSLVLNGESNSPQAEVIRDRIDAIRDVEETEPEHL